MIEITRAWTPEDLEGILELQTKNLRVNLSPETAASQGFLTLKHEPGVLKRMNDAEASVIAKENNEVVGYALVMLPSFKDDIPLLGDLFKAIESITYEGQAIRPEDFVVVGQLCVAESHRGQGLVERLYGHFRDALHEKYPYLITDISSNNPRSLKAHQKTGFKVIHTFYDSFAKEDWNIVLWDWRH